MDTPQLTGQFFLAMQPSRCISLDGRNGLLLRVREPAPAAMFPEGLTAAWFGKDAEAFMQAHELDLRPGRGVRLSLAALKAREGELRALVQACELLPLPPSWTKSASTQQVSQPT